MKLKQRGLSVWQALLGRTSFCAVLLCVTLLRLISDDAYWPILQNIMYPWAAALAFPLLRLEHVPKRRGMIFLFGFFLWYIVICYLNRQYSFYKHIYDWYMLLFAMFLFYPQDSAIPRATLLARVRVVLYVFLTFWSAMCVTALSAAVLHVRFTTPSSFFGIEHARLFVSCHPNTAGYLCVVASFFAFFLAGQEPRIIRVILGIDVGLQYVCLALTDSRTSIAAFCLGILLLTFSDIWRLFRAAPLALRRVLAVLAACVLAITCFAGTRGVFALYARLPVAMRQDVPAAIASPQQEVQPIPSADSSSSADESVVSPETATPTAILNPVAPPAVPDPPEPRALTEDNEGLNGRVGMWVGAMQMLRDHPQKILTGVTRIGVWEAVIPYSSNLYSVGSLHNAYLYTFVSCGLPGILLLIGFAIVIIPRAWKLLFGDLGKARRGLRALPVILCVLCITSFTEDLLFLTNHISNMLFFFAAGLTMYFTDPEHLNEA